jgi:hypothetical protein
VRGPTLQLHSAGESAEAILYRVYDDFGMIGDEGSYLSAPLPLAEALRLALELLYPHVEKPVIPCGGAGSPPWEILGYRRLETRRRLWGVIPLPGKSPPYPAIGPDGRPDPEVAGELSDTPGLP